MMSFHFWIWVWPHFQAGGLTQRLACLKRNTRNKKPKRVAAFKLPSARPSHSPPLQCAASCGHHQVAYACSKRISQAISPSCQMPHLNHIHIHIAALALAQVVISTYIKCGTAFFLYILLLETDSFLLAWTIWNWLMLHDRYFSICCAAFFYSFHFGLPHARYRLSSWCIVFW